MPASTPNLKRRRLLQTGALGLMASTGVLASSLVPTPRQPKGPFYPETLPLDDDADLTWFGDRKTRAKGEVTELQGHILDLNGKPVRNTRIEIWQCDANGRYRHSRDRGGDKVDPNFQGHGHTVSDALGRYRFKTIKPVSYPGRTPHIHVAVFPDGHRPVITQLYIAGEPRNDDDFLYRYIAAEKRHLVEAEFVAQTASSSVWSAEFDLIVGI